MTPCLPVTVIVPNYEGRDLLARCLPSILSQKPAPAEVIVVDNGSTDGSTQMVNRDFPSVRLIPLESNLGFARANNIAAGFAESPFLALVNNDCVACPGWLEALTDAMRSEDGVGAVASSMRNVRDGDIIDSAGGEIDYLGFMRDRGAGLRAAEFDTRTEVPFPCAGACLLNRDALEDGRTIFWDRLIFYMEDVDLGFRMRAGGWKVVYEPGAVILHEHSATGARDPLGKEIKCVRNRLLVLRRHFPAPLLTRMMPLLLSIQATWALSRLASLRFGQFRALLTGTWMGLTWPVDRYAKAGGHDLVRRFAVIPTGAGGARRIAEEAARRILEGYESPRRR